jgi:sporulation protein YlmC with PRC-barrel domain
MTIELVAELLDKRIHDRGGRYVGTVDSIVLEIDGDGPPKVSSIEVGVPAIARRLYPALARWRWLRRFPLTQLPMKTVSADGNDVAADIDAERHPTLLLVEKWLRTHIVERIPGNGR